MQDRYRHLDENLLQRTAGPYMRVICVDLGMSAGAKRRSNPVLSCLVPSWIGCSRDPFTVCILEGRTKLLNRFNRICPTGKSLLIFGNQKSSPGIKNISLRA
jgi:hypothetical protein